MWKVFNKNQQKQAADSATKEGKASAAAKAPADKPEVKKAEPKKEFAGHRIFLKPIVSEKVAHMGADDRYAFRVVNSANKVEIKKAFAALYGVRPISVNSANTPGKLKRSGRGYGLRSGWKKALVRVPKGSKITIFEGV